MNGENYKVKNWILTNKLKAYTSLLPNLEHNLVSVVEKMNKC